MLTKQDILNITGHTDIKKFYSEFPNEDSFKAKYGKQIDKFLRKKGVEQAQGGITMTPGSFGGYQPKGIPTQGTFTNTQTVNSFAPTGQQDQGIMSDLKNLTDEDIKTGVNYASAAGQAIKGYADARAGKKKAKETNEFLKAFSPVLAKASQGDMDRPNRKYLRPDDPAFLIQPDTLHNPIGSGQGLYAKNGGEIQNTFAPNTIYKDLDKANAGMVIEGIKTAGDIAAFFGGMNTKKFQEQNEQMMGQMGTQPAIQNLQANQYASYMEHGGMVNPQMATSLEGIPLTKLFAPDPMMDTLRTGGNIRQNQMAMGGNLEVDGRGHIEAMGYNPEIAKTGASGFVGISRGPSHDDGGFNLAYGENGLNVGYAKAGDQFNAKSPKMIEIEGGETVLETAKNGLSKDKSLNILGDLPIGSFDKSVADGVDQFVLSGLLKGKNLKDVKYKFLGNAMAKATGKLNRDESKYLKLLESSDPLTFSSGKAGEYGIGQKYINYKKLGDNLIDTQLGVNTGAEEMGVNPNKLAIGKLEPIKMNKSNQKAQNGITKEIKEEADKLYKSGQILEYQQYLQKVAPGIVDKIMKEQGVPTISGKWDDAIKGKRTQQSYKDLMATNPTNQFNSRISDSVFGNYKMPGVANELTSNLPEQQFSFAPPDQKSGRFDKNIADSMMMYANQLLPFIRPSDAEGLNPDQISGELMAMSTNQVMPVQAQKYSPQLRSSYNVSLADQLNRNQADYRAAQRMAQGNPAALAALNAQKYGANQQVLGEEFRLNQGLRDAIYSENLDKIAKADLINLELMDKQYGRQQQAISNTKAVQQAAVNSINAKILQNRLENRQLQAYENMYNYRFDDRFRAMNMNPLAQFNMEGSGTSTTPFGNMSPEEIELYAKQLKVAQNKQKEMSKSKDSARNGTLVKANK